MGKLKEIPTLWNPADLGKGGLSRRRRNMLLFLFCFVSEEGNRVGESQFDEPQSQEAARSAIKGVKYVLPEDEMPTILEECQSWKNRLCVWLCLILFGF